jgi:hypothetical protein
MLVRYFDQHVLDSIRNSVAADQVNQLWLSHPSLGNVGDPLGYSGREEQQLCLGSALAKYKLDIIFESITQQSIQLIVLVAQIRREQTTYAERERERERERDTLDQAFDQPRQGSKFQDSKEPSFHARCGPSHDQEFQPQCEALREEIALQMKWCD